MRLLCLILLCVVSQIKKKYNFFKLEVEEDMVLSLCKDWSDLNYYINSLKSKYRKRIKEILEKSKEIKIKDFGENDIRHYRSELQLLFNKVVGDSKFSGPNFNVQTFLS